MTQIVPIMARSQTHVMRKAMLPRCLGADQCGSTCASTSLEGFCLPTERAVLLQKLAHFRVWHRLARAVCSGGLCVSLLAGVLLGCRAG